MINHPIISEKASVSLIKLKQFQSNFEQPILSSCILKWRQNKLWVTYAQVSRKEMLPALQSQQWITDCLARSPIQQVFLDPKLGELVIRIWAEASAQVGKPVFLRLPSHLKRLKKQRSRSWQIKQILNWSMALLLLLALSPVLMGLALLVKASSPGLSLLSHQWCVSPCGKLFRRYQFRTTVAAQNQQENLEMTLVGKWLQRFHLDKLPQLFNMLRGEMHLVGVTPKTLSDVFQHESI